jgi:predicted RNase H-like HicB family nuclease
MGTPAHDRIAPALHPPHEERTGYSRREAKRYLEAEDPIQHPEAGRLVKGAAVRGYVVVFEGDNESGYSAYSPDLPGVVAAGATHDETERLMLDAMAEHLALLRQAGEPVPEPAEAESVTLLDPVAA